MKILQYIQFKFLILALIVLSSLYSCNSLECEPMEFEAKIVVDGWIEEGERAKVVLTQLVPTTATLDTATLSLIPIRWAKVTISNGDEREIMVAGRSDDYLTKFYYRTLHMKGEVGKTYSILVEYSNMKVTAECEVLEKPTLKSVKSSKVSSGSDSYALEIEIDDPEPMGDYYMVLTKVAGRDSIHKHSVMGVWNDRKLNSLGNKLPVYRSLSISDGLSDGILFEKGEVVNLKLCKITQTVYNYWLDHQELLISSANFIFPITSNARTNILNGLGCWYGINCDSRTVVVGEE